jgi:hypothetical protein
MEQACAGDEHSPRGEVKYIHSLWNHLSVVGLETRNCGGKGVGDACGVRGSTAERLVLNDVSPLARRQSNLLVQWDLATHPIYMWIR